MFDVGEYYYDNCKTDRWLRAEYITCFDAATQGALENVNVQVGTAYSTLDTIPRKAFILSTYEYNLKTSQVGHNIGVLHTYFDSDAKRVAKYLGTPVTYYTRSVAKSFDDNKCDTISATGLGGFESKTTTVAHGIRPAITLPLGFEVTVGVPTTANAVATAEVI